MSWHISDIDMHPDTSQYVSRVLWSTDTPRIRDVPVSDTCCVRQQQDTDTYNYTKLCDFLKLLAVSAC